MEVSPGAVTRSTKSTWIVQVRKKVEGEHWRVLQDSKKVTAHHGCLSAE